MLIKNLQEIQKLIGKEITSSRSPAGNWLKPRLENLSKGEAEISIIVRKEMCNPFGNIHGGMMALLIDETIGWAIISMEADSHYTSVNLNLDFLYAASLGEKITATAKIIRFGKKIINVEVHVLNESGTLLSKSASNLVVTSMKPVGL